MGKIKYLKNVESFFEKSSVVDFSSIQRLINNKKKIKEYPKQLIRNLILKKKINKLTKGYYTVFEDPSLLVFCLKPAYLGLQDSLSFYNVWEQETIPIILTNRKARQGIRKVLGGNVLIRRINKKYLFGFEYHKVGKFYLPYSNLEKTFIDMIYFKENLNENVIKNIRKRINKKKINSYLKNYPKLFRKRVLKILRGD